MKCFEYDYDLGDKRVLGKKFGFCKFWLGVGL